MSYKRFYPIFIALIILLFSINPLAKAAPPLQEGSQDSTSLGDSFNLDDDGNVIEDEPVGNNLGTIMSGKGDSDDEPVDGDDPDGDETDGDEATTLKEHPVAAAIAEYFGIPYQEVKDLHDSGYGFGNIAKAYFFAEQLELTLDEPPTPGELLMEARGSGWGNVLRANGIHPGSIGRGHSKHLNEGGEVDSLSNGQDVSGLAGPGGGHGNGNGKGKDKDHGGKGKGKGKNK